MFLLNLLKKVMMFHSAVLFDEYDNIIDNIITLNILDGHHSPGERKFFNRTALISV